MFDCRRVMTKTEDFSGYEWTEYDRIWYWYVKSCKIKKSDKHCDRMRCNNMTQYELCITNHFMGMYRICYMASLIAL